MSYNFNNQLEQDSKEYSYGKSQYFKFEEGDNKVRILSPGIVVGQHYLGKNTKPAVCVGEKEGCPHHGDNLPPARPQWMLYLWNYKAENVQQARMPYTVMQSLAKLQNHPEYKFDDLPMPYDITIVAVNAGTKEVQYTVMPARQNSDLPEKCQEQYAKKKPIQEVVDGMRLKSVSQDDDISPDSIPF